MGDRYSMIFLDHVLHHTDSALLPEFELCVQICWSVQSIIWRMMQNEGPGCSGFCHLLQTETAAVTALAAVCSLPGGNIWLYMRLLFSLVWTISLPVFLPYTFLDVMCSSTLMSWHCSSFLCLCCSVLSNVTLISIHDMQTLCSLTVSVWQRWVFYLCWRHAHIWPHYLFSDLCEPQRC